MKLTYIPSEDALVLTILPAKGYLKKKLGPIHLWLDQRGNICSIVIENYTEELKEFRKNLNVIQLGGIWKDVKVTEEEIVSTRKELLKKLDRKW